MDLSKNPKNLSLFRKSLKKIEKVQFSGKVFAENPKNQQNMKLFKVINPPTHKELLYAASDKEHAYEVAKAVLTEFWITSRGICEKQLPMDKAMAYIEEIPGYSIEGKPGLVYSDFNPIKVGE